MKKFYTTGQVAKICGIGITTVKKYCDQGRIKAVKSPITHYRRIPRESLIKFMKKYHLSLSELSGEKKRILVVDDEEDVTDYISRALKTARKGYLVQSTNNGYEACLRLPDFLPHLVILDIRMPGIDGREVLKVIKEHPSCEAKVLVITGFPEDLNEMRELGADDYLIKPIKMVELRKRVTKLLSKEYSPAVDSSPGSLDKV